MARSKRRVRRGEPSNPDIATIEIRNPHGLIVPDLVRDPNTAELVYREQRVTAVRSLRDDPLARLHDRAQITEAQYRAGRRWQALYEGAEVGRIGSIDPSNEPVDGGNRIPAMLTDRRQRATKQLAALDVALGDAGKAIVRDVLGEGLSLSQVALRHGMQPDKRLLEYLGRRFRECLDTLAKQLGFG